MSYTLSELPVQIDADKPSTIYLHAIEAGKVIGMLRLEVDEPAGYIGACFIVPEHRGKGIGTRLIERACELSLEHGFKTIGLSVNKENATWFLAVPQRSR